MQPLRKSADRLARSHCACSKAHQADYRNRPKSSHDSAIVIYETEYARNRHLVTLILSPLGDIELNRKRRICGNAISQSRRRNVYEKQAGLTRSICADLFCGKPIYYRRTRRSPSGRCDSNCSKRFKHLFFYRQLRRRTHVRRPASAWVFRYRRRSVH